MLSEKDMANDALESKKMFSVELTQAAAECSNPQLKQTFIQMRNKTEQSQEQIAAIAIRNGWYMPASEAEQQEINQIKSFYQQNLQTHPANGNQTFVQQQL